MNSDTLVGALIGAGATLLGTAAPRFWTWLDERRELDRILKGSRLAIESTVTGEAAASELFHLRNSILSHPELLNRPKLREFFDSWLRDPLLEQGKMPISLQADDDDLMLLRLKKDVAKLTD